MSNAETGGGLRARREARSVDELSRDLSIDRALWRSRVVGHACQKPVDLLNSALNAGRRFESTLWAQLPHRWPAHLGHRAAMINPDESKSELTETLLEIGAKLFPRRYHRFKDLRSDQQACEWARTLDWRQNPYDRFLLRREILHHLESTAFYDGPLNVYSFASRDEIAAEVDRLMKEFPDKYKSLGVFSYVLVMLPWNLAFKHGRVQNSRLAEALDKLP